MSDAPSKPPRSNQQLQNDLNYLCSQIEVTERYLHAMSQSLMTMASELARTRETLMSSEQGREDEPR